MGLWGPINVFCIPAAWGTCSNCFELQKAASGMCLAPSPTLGGGKDVGW